MHAYTELPQKAFSITHASEISAARRHGNLLAEQAGFGEFDAGRLAIVVTEAGTNILKHGRDGMLVLRGVAAPGRRVVEVIAIDKGPGIENLARSMRDGISTAGTAGTGLGAMRRQADVFDVYSVPGKGTGIYLEVHAALAGSTVPGDAFMTTASAHAAEAAEDVSLPASRLRIGIMNIALAGEDACGDGWAVIEDHVGARLVVADGLGHGPGAAIAAHAAVAALEAGESLAAAGLIEAMHEVLRPTRGAAVAAARLSFQHDRITFAGVGNISACVIHDHNRRQLVSHNGIVGHNLRKVQEFAGDWPPGALAIFCSDGIGTQWDLQAYPGLTQCHPSLIAAVLYRDFMRVRDDATVLVIQRLH